MDKLIKASLIKTDNEFSSQGHGIGHGECLILLTLIEQAILT